MSDKVENPFAYPQSTEIWGGATLRDYFAGQALTTCNFNIIDHRNTYNVAAACYEMADAMLKERAK
jgi:hypothetical protein